MNEVGDGDRVFVSLLFLSLYGCCVVVPFYACAHSYLIQLYMCLLDPFIRLKAYTPDGPADMLVGRAERGKLGPGDRLLDRPPGLLEPAAPRLRPSTPATQSPIRSAVHGADTSGCNASSWCMPGPGDTASSGATMWPLYMRWPWRGSIRRRGTGRPCLWRTLCVVSCAQEGDAVSYAPGPTTDEVPEEGGNSSGRASSVNNMRKGGG